MQAVSPAGVGASRRARIRGALTPVEWRRVAGLAAVIAGLHAVGFFSQSYLRSSGDFFGDLDVVALAGVSRHAAGCQS